MQNSDSDSDGALVVDLAFLDGGETQSREITMCATKAGTVCVFGSPISLASLSGVPAYWHTSGATEMFFGGRCEGGYRECRAADVPTLLNGARVGPRGGKGTLGTVDIYITTKGNGVARDNWLLLPTFHQTSGDPITYRVSRPTNRECILWVRVHKPIHQSGGNGFYDSSMQFSASAVVWLKVTDF